MRRVCDDPFFIAGPPRTPWWFWLVALLVVGSPLILTIGGMLLCR